MPRTISPPTSLPRLQSLVLVPPSLEGELEKLVLVVTDKDYGYQEVCLGVVAPSLDEDELTRHLDAKLPDALTRMSDQWVNRVRLDQGYVHVMIQDRYLLGPDSTDLVLAAAETALRTRIPRHRVYAIHGDQQLVLVEENSQTFGSTLEMTLQFPGELEFVNGNLATSIEAAATQVAQALVRHGAGRRARIDGSPYEIKVTVSIGRLYQHPSEPLLARIATDARQALASQIARPDYTEYVFRSSRIYTPPIKPAE